MKTHNDAMHIAHKFALVKRYPNAVLHVCAIPNMYSKMTYCTTSTFKVLYLPCVDM